MVQVITVDICTPCLQSTVDTWTTKCWSCVNLKLRISPSGQPLYLNVNVSIASPCVHTFMYVFKVTRRPGWAGVTEQKGFWQQYFVALTNSGSTVMLKYLFHVPSLHSGNTSEGRTESHRWNTFKFTSFFSLHSTNLKCSPHIMQGFFLLFDCTSVKIMSICWPAF